MELKELVNARYVSRKMRTPHDLVNARIIVKALKKHTAENSSAENALSEEMLYTVLADIKEKNRRGIEKDTPNAYVRLNHVADMAEILFNKKVDRFRAGYFTGKSVMCDCCKNKAEFKDSSIIYGKSYGMIWYCPNCKNYVGVHKGTDIPLGTITDKKTKAARQSAHKALEKYFDNRNEAYAWIRKTMNLDRYNAHIGRFTKEQCEKLEELLCARAMTTSIKKEIDKI